MFVKKKKKKNIHHYIQKEKNETEKDVPRKQTSSSLKSKASGHTHTDKLTTYCLKVSLRKNRKKKRKNDFIIINNDNSNILYEFEYYDLKKNCQNFIKIQNDR